MWVWHILLISSKKQHMKKCLEKIYLHQENHMRFDDAHRFESLFILYPQKKLINSRKVFCRQKTVHVSFGYSFCKSYISHLKNMTSTDLV